MAGNTLQITMAEPTDTTAVEELQNAVNKELSVCVSTEKDIVDAYKKYYGISDEESQDLSSPRRKRRRGEPMSPRSTTSARSGSEAADDFEIDSGDERGNPTSFPPPTPRSSSW